MTQTQKTSARWRAVKPRKGIFVSGISLLLTYTALLWTDVQLTSWYSEFYSAIQEKEQNAFFHCILIFIAIGFSQAFLFASIAILSDLLEANLKAQFANDWAQRSISTLSPQINDQTNGQRIIDDAGLAAEKVANVLPALIFNTMKALVFFLMLMKYSFSTELTCFGAMCITVTNPIPIACVMFVLVQIAITVKTRKWVARSEDLKRRIELKARSTLAGEASHKIDMKKIVQRYIEQIFKIRIAVAKAHGITSFALNLLGAYSFLIPFTVLFTAYVAGLFHFGELMKISAIFAGFQGSAMYIFNFYKEGFRGWAALTRLYKTY